MLKLFARDNKQIDEETFQMVAEVVAKKLGDISKEQFLESLQTVSDKKFWDDIGMTILKSYGSLGAYGSLYNGPKQAIRTGQLWIIESNLRNDKISVPQALLSVLDGTVGFQDKNSLKFKLVNELFGLGATTHEQAKEIVQCTIQALKNGGATIALQEKEPLLEERKQLT